MIEFDICGYGAWSERFANASDLAGGLQSGQWPEAVALQPEVIPPRERRRAPLFVKMAVEVMLQACRMAAVEPGRPACVFASHMSDMETTDYICRVLAQSPELISPTRFHNSVHNAAVGYWSIATGSTAPANAIAAFEWSVPIALLEAATQVASEGVPVLAVAQDSTPPGAFDYICPGARSFAAALLLTPAGSERQPLARCRLQARSDVVDWPRLPRGLPDGLASNRSARLLPLLALLGVTGEQRAQLAFPLGGRQSLQLDLHRLPEA